MEIQDIPFHAYTGTEPYLFVSYAHLDRGIVYPEIARLNAQGYRIWYDEGIPSTTEWREVIGSAIIHCTVFVIFISRSAVASENVRQELGLAQGEKRPIMAIYLEDTPLTPGMKLQLNATQGIVKWQLSLDEYGYRLFTALPPTVRRAGEVAPGSRVLPSSRPEPIRDPAVNRYCLQRVLGMWGFGLIFPGAVALIFFIAGTYPTGLVEVLAYFTVATFLLIPFLAALICYGSWGYKNETLSVKQSIIPGIAYLYLLLYLFIFTLAVFKSSDPEPLYAGQILSMVLSLISTGLTTVSVVLIPFLERRS